MILSRKLKLQDCTLTTTLPEPSKVVVSKGQARVLEYHGADYAGIRQLTDDVEYTIPLEDQDVRSVMGYLVLVCATGELDVLVDEIRRSESKVLHDWKYDTDHIYLHPIFSVELQPSEEPVIVVWGDTEG